MNLGNKGSLHLPLALLLIGLTAASFGLLAFMRSWRMKAELQLRLDQCVSKLSWELADAENLVESENLKIEVTRAALQGPGLLPAVRVALQTALQISVTRQEFALGKWRVRRLAWVGQRGCDRKSDLPLPLPDMGWTRDPPDPVGSKALHWTGGAQKTLRIQLHHPPRSSSAEIRADGNLGGKWNAHWTSPTTLLTRPGSD